MRQGYKAIDRFHNNLVQLASLLYSDILCVCLSLYQLCVCGSGIGSVVLSIVQAFLAVLLMCLRVGGSHKW